MSQYLLDRITRHPASRSCPACAVREVDGTGRLERVTIEDLTTSTRRTLAAAALFVLIGAEAHTQWLAESIELDSHGFIVTGPDISRPARNAAHLGKAGPGTLLARSQPAGCGSQSATVRSNSVKRVASASARARSPSASPPSTSAAAPAWPPPAPRLDLDGT